MSCCGQRSGGAKFHFDFSGDDREGERPWDFSWALQNTLEKNYDVRPSVMASGDVRMCPDPSGVFRACARVTCTQEQSSIDHKIRQQLKSRRRRGIQEEHIIDDEDAEDEIEQQANTKKSKEKATKNAKSSAKKKAVETKDDAEDDEQDDVGDDQIKEVVRKATKKQEKEACQRFFQSSQVELTS